mgnify:CR=1 FL=1
MKWLVPFLALLILNSCENKDVLCTMEFRMLSVEILGDSTDRVYSIDSRNGDTIEGYEIFDSNWCFADDGEWFNRLKENEKRTINVKAISKSGKSVSATCVVTRDACHIEKVSGPNSIAYQ